MKIGIPKEVKSHEYRIGMIPSGVEMLVKAGNKVFIEKNAGTGSGIPDEDYIKVGAEIINSKSKLYSKSELIVKVKEPLPEEYDMLQSGQIIFTYFHFAASEELTRKMVEKNVICIAYETVQLEDRTLPLLIPMSEVAGRMSVHEGAKYLEKPMQGEGILLAGVPGVAPADVVIIGAGIVGTNAAKIAAGLGANVFVLDVDLSRLRYLDDIMSKNVKTIMSNPYNIREVIKHADLVIGAVLIPGAKAPRLITRDMLSTMKPGSVIVDVSIDQGGSTETSRPTTHENPTFIIDRVNHYCVANMPGAVGRTSTYALTNATLPYVFEIANKGYKKAAKENMSILYGLNTIEGKITYKAVADTFKMEYCPAEKLIG
jgi:alanine dehydrogenase